MSTAVALPRPRPRAAVFGFRAAHSRSWRWLFAAHPIVMAVAVTATGNHPFLSQWPRSSWS